MIIKSFKIFENNQPDKIVYHGSDEKHDFTKSGSIHYGTFFSTSKNEAKSYCDIENGTLYEVTLKPNLYLFDTAKLSDCEILMNEFKTLYDDYYDEETEPNQYYIKSAKQLQENTDNWNPIEHTDGVLDWLSGKYDGVWIYEGSIRNLFLFTPVEIKINNIKEL